MEMEERGYYLYQQYPEATDVFMFMFTDIASTQGHYPIHVAILSTRRRDNPATAVDIVRFLLDCDPNQKLVQYQLKGASLLHFACAME